MSKTIPHFLLGVLWLLVLYLGLYQIREYNNKETGLTETEIKLVFTSGDAKEGRES